MRYPLHLRKLIEQFKKLPGVGSKSAERFAFQLLTWKDLDRQEFANLISQSVSRLSDCTECGLLCESDNCLICNDKDRDSKIICVVVSQREVFSFEETGQFRGLYHVLGSLFSPLQGRALSQDKILKLKERISNRAVSEVIIAIDATLEGDATALYIKENIQDLPLKVSRIAFGLPQNCSLEFVDGSTLSSALKGRLIF
jgi:recombination protein RecR